MTGVGRNHALVGPQSGGNHRQIGLGSPCHEMDVHILPAAFFSNQLGGAAAMLVLPIAGGLLHIGLNQALQNLGVGAFGIIAVESNHRLALLFLFLLFQIATFQFRRFGRTKGGLISWFSKGP